MDRPVQPVLSDLVPYGLSRAYVSDSSSECRLVSTNIWQCVGERLANGVARRQRCGRHIVWGGVTTPLFRVATPTKVVGDDAAAVGPATPERGRPLARSGSTPQDPVALHGAGVFPSPCLRSERSRRTERGSGLPRPRGWFVLRSSTLTLATILRGPSCVVSVSDERINSAEEVARAMLP